MSARPVLAIAAAKYWPPEYAEPSAGTNPPKSRKKPLAEGSRSTARVSGRCFVQRRDIEDAIRWRLRGLDQEDIATIADRLRPLVARLASFRAKVRYTHWAESIEKEGD